MKSSKSYITRLRFPLAVGVVMIHSIQGTPQWNSVADLDALGAAKWWFSSTLPSLAVPLFFVISGFLFFRGIHRFSWQFFIEKWQRRVFTLLIPYLVWNILAFLERWGRSGWDDVATHWHSLGGWNIFWGAHSIGSDSTNWWDLPLGHLTAPIDVPLWFVRDLMVVTFFTPLYWWLLHNPRRGIYALSAMFFVYLSQSWMYVGGVSGASFSLFGLGAACALWEIDLLAAVRPFRWLSYTGFLLLTLTQFFGKGHLSAWAMQIVCTLTLFVGIAAYINCAGTARGKISSTTRFLSESSFFIFAAHTVGILSGFDHLLRQCTDSQSEWCRWLRYLGMPLLSICACLLLFFLLRKFLPRLSAPLTGIWQSRNNKH